MAIVVIVTAVVVAVIVLAIVVVALDHLRTDRNDAAIYDI